jgi:hypothetical protein
MEINTRKFEAAHGKRPRGYGNWAFCPADKYEANDYLAHVMWFTGKYSEVKDRAARFFAGKTSEVVVCS